MLNLTDIVNSKLSFTKDLINDQTQTGMTVRFNTGGIAFSANGYGTSTATSTVVLAHIGGFDDQKMTATMKYVSPTNAGSEDFGVLLRFQSIETSPTTTYYSARCSSGLAKLTRVVGGTITNLSTSAFALAQNTYVTITFSVVGNALSASFVASGGSPATVNLSATDSNITSGGLIGFRTTASTGICSGFTAEQL